MEIKAIDQSTVHRICSGQVVLTLAVAVKELVENAIDAGANSVEVRLVESGSKLIEVIDNGRGVEESNFAGLTLKHHTSKIGSFEDLESGVNTFGFRGEALSSLCALSKLSVTTRHRDAVVATKIDYDYHGVIVKRSRCARQVGTTVSLADLFTTLPVRHKEFLRNLKKEFHKMVHLLNAYCIISSNVKISCSNVNSNGKRSVVVSTNGSSMMSENIASVFGSKQLSSLKTFSQLPATSDHLEEFAVKHNSDDQPFSLTGLVSSSCHGSGRGSVDRQFYFINGRPCEIDKLSRLVNEIYHSYNRHQYPCVFIDIQVDRGAVDVNVTPDKRKIFLDYESILLATIKTSLVSLWEPESCTYSRQQLSQPDPTHSQTEGKTSQKRTLAELFSKVKEQAASKKRFTLDSFVQRGKSMTLAEDRTPGCSTSTRTEADPTIDNVSILHDNDISSAQPLPTTSNSTDLLSDEVVATPSDKLIDTPTHADCESLHADINSLKYADATPEGVKDTLGENYECAITSRTADRPHAIEDAPSSHSRKVQGVTFSLEALRQRFGCTSLASDDVACPKFRAKISPDQNGVAESELQQSISKSDFSKMEVLGQFNRGFIICRLASDLFIIDQHATDEKYNFEMLQRDTIIKRQTLLVPKPLHLSSANELLLMDNLETFHKNGFEFDINEGAEATKRVSMKTQPVSKNWSFGKDDIDEMLYMLRETPERFYRPSRIREMFASRACRKSVMIGKPLDKQEMRRLVQHMGEIEQPWNCPHGRPTMRHLVNLDLIQQ